MALSTITAIRHPDFLTFKEDWEKYRLTYSGGSDFIERYLEKLSSRETTPDFNTRKKMTYCPAFAKAAINEIKNAIFQRMVDVQRVGGSELYQQAVKGENLGVDLSGSSMNSYMGTDIIPELLVMKKVGIFVDMPLIVGETIAETGHLRPYCYRYQAEDILSWEYVTPGIEGEFSKLLLYDHVLIRDSDTGLPSEKTDRFRFIQKVQDGITVQFYDTDGLPIGPHGEKDGGFIFLKIPQIPFVLIETPESMLRDIADYQIALLNMESSDVSYVVKSNYPFFTEQYDPRSEQASMKPPASVGTDGEKATTDIARGKEITVGATQGRRYPISVDRPAFINPSSEPLVVSMQKGDQLKRDIRILIDLAVTNLSVKMASAESKDRDQRGLESGLSYIGLLLERGERQIAKYWDRYIDKKQEVAVISYPRNYNLKTDDERYNEASKLEELLHKMPSDLYKREMLKQIARVTLGDKINQDTLNKIQKEIDNAPTVVSDPSAILGDLEAGLVSDETASVARGYPKEEVDKARADRAKRIALTMEAQGGEGGQARGANDFQLTSAEEKTDKAVRGEAK